MSAFLPTPFQVASLSKLGQIDLDEFHQRHFDAGMKSCFGKPAEKKRKGSELHDLLALAQVSGKIEPLAANLEGPFQAHFILRAAVPVKTPSGKVEILDWAHIHLCYPEEAIRESLPGTSFVRIMMPQGIWLPNVAGPNTPGQPGGLPDQRLCLGTSMLAGVRVRELVLMTYGALTMQSVQMNAFDPAGVLNPEAAEWWQANGSMIPLTDKPFLDSDA